MSELESMGDRMVESRDAVLKAVSVGAREKGIDTSNARVEEGKGIRFQNAGAIDPPYDPRTLWNIYECSSALRQCVEAYSANIDGHGYHLEPVIDLNADDARDKIAEAMLVSRMYGQSIGTVVTVTAPTEVEIDAQRERLRAEMMLEHFRIESFFDDCTNGEISFARLRADTREDIEVTGNGYLEVLRDNKERIAQFERLPSSTMRLLPRDTSLTAVTVPVRTGPLSIGDELKSRRFRRFVQIVDNAPVFFKQFGDPRVMSHATGKVFDSVLALKNEEPTSRPATEVIHFKINANGAYGIPRWIGAYFAVAGTQKAEHVNYLYFDNKGVPPLALLVSGATINDSSVKKIEDYIKTELAGVQNFHKMLIIQAESQASSDPDAAPPGRVRIELKPLTQAQQSDALFQKYDERNADKIGQQFRLPRIVRGDVRDFNRATAESALEFTEGQVFGPLRNDFDFLMSRLVLRNELRSIYFTFQSNAIQLRDPAKVADIIAKLTTSNVLVPADARDLVERLVFYNKLRKIDADWLYQPPMLTQTGMLPDESRDGVIPHAPPSGGSGGSAPAPTAKRVISEKDAKVVIRSLLAMRETLAQTEAANEVEDLKTAKSSGGDDSPTIISMSPAEMAARFDLKLS